MKKTMFILVVAIVLGLMVGSLSLAYAKGPLGPKPAVGTACTPTAACPTSGPACSTAGSARGGCPKGSTSAKPAASDACGGACSAQ